MVIDNIYGRQWLYVGHVNSVIKVQFLRKPTSLWENRMVYKKAFLGSKDMSLSQKRPSSMSGVVDAVCDQGGA